MKLLDKYGVASLRASIGNAFPFSISPAHTEAGHFYKREDTGRVAASVTTKLGFVAKGYLYKWYAKLTAEHIRTNLDRLIKGDISVLDEAQHAGERSRDDSAGIGTKAHEAIDKYLSLWIQEDKRPTASIASFLTGDNGSEIAACRSYERFLNENEVIPIASELSIWYEVGKDCYAGTIDAILLILNVHKERHGSGTCKHDYVTQPSGILWCTSCGREVKAQLILADLKTSNSIKGKEEYAHQTEAYTKSIEKAVGLKFDGIWIIRVSKDRSEYEILTIRDRKQAWKEWLSISRAYDQSRKREGVSLLSPLQVKQVIQI